MKSVLFAVSICTLLLACKDQTKTDEKKGDLLSTNIVNNPRSAAGTDQVAMANMANMGFADSLYDFGNIDEGEVVTHEFSFTNTGKSPLIISSADGSCGCTVADFPHEPVQPGKTGTITTRFNSAGKPGHQEKSVTLKTNSSRGNHMLFIKGEVKAKK
jgi:hypothetical protein